jgi:hypothetical protein
MLSTLLQFCGTVAISGTLSAAPLLASTASSALPASAVLSATPTSTASPALSASAASPFFVEQSTVSLNSAESVVFLGITGDYKATTADELAEWLLKEKKVVVVGESIRSMGDASRRVWAVKSEDPKKLVKSLKSGLKKQGFKATPLLATALTPLNDNSRALKAAMRDVEKSEKKIWTLWGGGRDKAVWVFHERKIDSKRIESVFRKTESKMSFYHQEFCFKSDALSGEGKVTEASVNVESMSETAAASMDCLKVISRDGGLVMDLYMRDMSSVLLLSSDNGRHQFLCPNVHESPVKRLQVPELNWTVTLEGRGVPFLK